MPARDKLKEEWQMAQSSNADEEKQVAQLLELARSMEDAREWQYLPLRVEQGVNVLLNTICPKRPVIWRARWWLLDIAAERCLQAGGFCGIAGDDQ